MYLNTNNFCEVLRKAFISRPHKHAFNDIICWTLKGFMDSFMRGICVDFETWIVLISRKSESTDVVYLQFTRLKFHADLLM